MSKDVELLIIGSGFGGIGMAIEAGRRGITDYVIVEQAGDLGGTWRDNTYPGAACDVKATLYHFSFAPWTWSRAYPAHDEILAYIRRIADDFRVTPHIEFNAAVSRMTWDGAESRWRVDCANGQSYRARFVVSATGQLNRPRIPAFTGADTFAGASFHTARFDHSVSLEQKRVAIIGSGASTIQVAPAIAGRVAQLDIYQRSAPYVLPKLDPETTTPARFVQRYLPLLTNWSRAKAYLYGELIGSGLVGKRDVRAKARAQWEMYVSAVVADPDLRRRIEPDYEIGCKRILLASDWYPTLQRDNVELVTEAIQEFTTSGITTCDGQSRHYDVVIYATGFESTDFVAPIEIVGRDGRNLHAEWGRRPLAHRGVAVAGFPNFFVLYGPNTNLGSNSILFMLESQFRYVASLMQGITDMGWSGAEVAPQVMDEWRTMIDSASQDTAWLQGCQSWYTVDGVNTNNWPKNSWQYHTLMQDVDIENYQPA